MTNGMRRGVRTALLAMVVAVPGCASLGALGNVLQPPRFSVGGQQAEFRFQGPSAQRPLGGLAVRLWARVENPNAFGVRLTDIDGGLMLEGTRAADVRFPLGLPLGAAQDTVIPIDVGVSFSELPGLVDVARRAASGQSIRYRLDGTFGVDAGVLGTPRFGPNTLLEGSVAVRR
jgi:hypothetical protein